MDTIADCVEAKRNRVDDDNHNAASLDEEKRKIFAEKFGESQASISFDPQKVDLIRWKIFCLKYYDVKSVFF